jgi:hypothetical protein
MRTRHRRESVCLYRLNTAPDDAGWLLLIYLARIDELAEHPEFYHLLTNDQHHALRQRRRSGRRVRYDRQLPSGRVDTTLPFDDYGGTL